MWILYDGPVALNFLNLNLDKIVEICSFSFYFQDWRVSLSWIYKAIGTIDQLYYKTTTSHVYLNQY